MASQNLTAVALAIAAAVMQIENGEIRIIIRKKEITDIFPTRHLKPHEILEENAEVLLTAQANSDKL